MQELIPDIEAYITSGMKGSTYRTWPSESLPTTGYIRQGFRRAQQATDYRLIRGRFSRSARPPRRSSPRPWRSWSIAAGCGGTTAYVDLYPEFRLKDPWVTREFVSSTSPRSAPGFRLLVNDILVMLNFKSRK